MKRYLYCLALIMSAILVQVSAQTSGPSYDQKTPPAFEWGTGKRNPQTQGTPTKDDHTIINNISVTVDSVDEKLTGSGSGKSVADITESILEEIGSNSTELSSALATITEDLQSLSSNIKDESDTATDTVMFQLRSIGQKITEEGVRDLLSSDSISIYNMLEEELKNQTDSISTTNNLIGSNTDKLVATVTYTVPGMGDGSSDTAEVQSISQILARQFGDMINNSSYDYDDESGEFYESYSVPPVCRFLCDMENLLYKILDTYLGCEIVEDGRTKMIFALFSDNLIEESEGSDSISSTIGIADELISREPIQIAATYSRSLTVADGLFTDKDGNPTHVLGRILNAVENGGSTSSSGSTDLSKLERAVGVVLNEGSDADKGEPPEVDIKLVDMFYDKGTGLGDFGFRGDDSAYLDEGVSMYDMTKAGLFGSDEYGNIVPSLQEMLRVSKNKVIEQTKAADLVYDINEKIPAKNKMASLTEDIALISKTVGSSTIASDTVISRLKSIEENLFSTDSSGNVATSAAQLISDLNEKLDGLITLPSRGMDITSNFEVRSSAKEFGSSYTKVPAGCSRQFIEIVSNEGDEGEFYIAFNSSGSYRKVKGRILLNLESTASVWIKNTSTTTVTVTEGWR